VTRTSHRLACAKADGFSLHAGVTVGARDSAKRERLCRYLARPPWRTTA
jgi:hypothetical protein